MKDIRTLQSNKIKYWEPTKKNHLGGGSSEDDKKQLFLLSVWILINFNFN